MKHFTPHAAIEACKLANMNVTANLKTTIFITYFLGLLMTSMKMKLKRIRV